MVEKTREVKPKQDQVIVRYGEIGLKSPGIRRHLESLLQQHLKLILTRRGLPVEKIKRGQGRLFIQTSNPDEVSQKISQVFGVVSSSPVWSTPPTLKAIDETVRLLVPKLLNSHQSFAIRARRTGHQDFSSQDVARLIGASVIEIAKTEKHEIRVDLENPDIEIHIEVRDRNAFIFTKIYPGPGGLPYGSQGTLIGLHSGGIDSPVAQWQLMKRGARVIPLFLDTGSSQDSPLRQRAIRAAKLLAEWIPHDNIELLVIPFRKFLETIKKGPNPKYTCVLCKRMMYRFAAAVANQEQAAGIVTGETLGQVASQTLANLTRLNQATSLPIFRPLIGMDKTETTKLAQQIGTYNASGENVGVCFAVPTKPTIEAQSKEIEKIEKSLNIEEIIKTSIRKLERIPLR